MSNSHSKSFIVGAMLGVAIGSMTGFLLAPKKGVETRKQLKKRLDEYGKKFNDSIHEMSDKGVGLPEEAIKMGRSLLAVAESQFSNVMDSIKTPEADTKKQHNHAADSRSEHIPSHNVVTQADDDSSSTPVSHSRKKRFFKGI